jgi:hypothetical protein
MPAPYTDITFTNAREGGITAQKLNKLRDDLSAAIGGGGTGTGDMTKAVYDTNNNGKVDTCDSVPWGSVTGAPSTFAPSPHQGSHVSGTDQIPSAGTSARGLMPQANGNANAFYSSDGTQKQVAYTMLSGSQPGPVAHAASHLDNGIDPIPVASTTRTGLAPVLSGNAATYLNGGGAFNQVAYANVTGTPTVPAPSSTTPAMDGTGAVGIGTTYARNDHVHPFDTSRMAVGAAPTVHAASHLDNGTDVIPVVTTLRTGLTPKLDGNVAHFLTGTGTWAAIGGGGDMLKSVYDTNADNIVDHAALADTAPWTGITGKPATFAPDLTAIWKGFIAKTAAYTLTSADSGKYIICSGGSWTLTLPAPALGLVFQVRNDMGLSGTTGTITLQPTGGTIDGQAAIALLPQQECTLITDGTNWRTYGLKREVILGTLDISVSTASASILLPAGFRFFDLLWTGLQPAVNRDGLAFQLSFNGGSTWQTTGYYGSVIYNNAATTAASVQYSNVANAIASSGLNNTTPIGESRVTLWPGTATMPATYILQGQGNDSTIGDSVYRGGGRIGTVGVANALKYFCTGGNTLNAFLTVKGAV